MLYLIDGERWSRRDDYRRSLTRPDDARGRGFRVNELQRSSVTNTPMSSRDSDADSIGSGGDRLDDLQRQRMELLSQLKVLSPSGRLWS